MEIREASPDDAGVVLALFERLCAQTTFLLHEPDEQGATVEEFARRLERMRKEYAGVVYLASVGLETAGVIVGSRGAARRNRHSMSVVLGVLQSYWNRGVGMSLLRAVEDWASTQGLHRLELTVQQRNTRAVALYEKAGFAIEGTRRHALVVNGAYVDEWFMSKLIADGPSASADG